MIPQLWYCSSLLTTRRQVSGFSSMYSTGALTDIGHDHLYLCEREPKPALEELSTEQSSSSTPPLKEGVTVPFTTDQENVTLRHTEDSAIVGTPDQVEGGTAAYVCPNNLVWSGSDNTYNTTALGTSDVVHVSYRKMAETVFYGFSARVMWSYGVPLLSYEYDPELSLPQGSIAKPAMLTSVFEGLLPLLSQIFRKLSSNISLTSGPVVIDREDKILNLQADYKEIVRLGVQVWRETYDISPEDEVRLKFLNDSHLAKVSGMGSYGMGSYGMGSLSAATTGNTFHLVYSDYEQKLGEPLRAMGYTFMCGDFPLMILAMPRDKRELFFQDVYAMSDEDQDYVLHKMLALFRLELRGYRSLLSHSVLKSLVGAPEDSLKDSPEEGRVGPREEKDFDDMKACYEGKWSEAPDPKGLLPVWDTYALYQKAARNRPKYRWSTYLKGSYREGFHLDFNQLKSIKGVSLPKVELPDGNTPQGVIAKKILEDALEKLQTCVLTPHTFVDVPKMDNYNISPIQAAVALGLISREGLGGVHGLLISTPFVGEVARDNPRRLIEEPVEPDEPNDPDSPDRNEHPVFSFKALWTTQLFTLTRRHARGHDAFDVIGRAVNDTRVRNYTDIELVLKRNLLEGPLKDITDTLKYIRDGKKIYHDWNKVCPSLLPISGSLESALSKSLINHKEEAEISIDLKIKALGGSSTGIGTMKAMPSSWEFPEKLEKFRVKSQEHLVMLGHLCGHCVGGRKNSKDLFFTYKKVVAQVKRDFSSVYECRDQHNQVTSTSLAFRRFLERHIRISEEHPELYKIKKGEELSPSQSDVTTFVQINEANLYTLAGGENVNLTQATLDSTLHLLLVPTVKCNKDTEYSVLKIIETVKEGGHTCSKLMDTTTA